LDFKSDIDSLIFTLLFLRPRLEIRFKTDFSNLFALELSFPCFTSSAILLWSPLLFRSVPVLLYELGDGSAIIASGCSILALALEIAYLHWEEEEEDVEDVEEDDEPKLGQPTTTVLRTLDGAGVQIILHNKLA